MSSPSKLPDRESSPRTSTSQIGPGTPNAATKGPETNSDTLADSAFSLALANFLQAVGTTPEHLVAMAKRQQSVEPLDHHAGVKSSKPEGEGTIEDDQTKRLRIESGRSDSKLAKGEAETAARSGPGAPDPMAPPIIKDEKISRRVFTHPCVATIQPGKPDVESYEPLEFVGDAYIELIATRFIQGRAPYGPVRANSTLRESLVCNENLAKYACRFGFSARMDYVRQKMNMLTDKAWSKILADVFEAYVAGVIEDDPVEGFQRVETWLIRLFNETLRLEKKNGSASAIVAATKREFNIATAKAELNTMLIYPPAGAKVEYREIDTPVRTLGNNTLFKIGVFLTGWGHHDRMIGQGSGSSKGRAGNEAAFDALTNNYELVLDANRQRAEYELKRKLGGMGMAENIRLSLLE